MAGLAPVTPAAHSIVQCRAGEMPGAASSADCSHRLQLPHRPVCNKVPSHACSQHTKTILTLRHALPTTGLLAAACPICTNNRCRPARHRYVTSLPPMQTAPLHFDYSGPVATATLDLRTQLAPFPKPLSEYLFPRLAADPMYMQLALQEQPVHVQQPQAQQAQQQQQLPTCAVDEPLVELPTWHALDASPSARILSPSQQVR